MLRISHPVRIRSKHMIVCWQQLQSGFNPCFSFTFDFQDSPSDLRSGLKLWIGCFIKESNEASGNTSGRNSIVSVLLL